MKNLTLYMCLAALAFSSVACNSDDPAEASEKKVYAEGENPYLRTNTAATNAMTREFPLARIDEPFVINLKDYATSFHKNLNMTVDEVLAGLKTGEVVFYNINTSRNRWDITPATLGEYGWYYSSNGLSSAEDACFTMELLPDQKCIQIKAVNEHIVGTTCNMDFGFAINNGSNFDDYVRFTPALSITDPSTVVLNVTIPAGGYSVYSINFYDYEEAFQISLGISAAEAVKMIESDPVKMEVYLRDADGNRVLTDGKKPAYTAGALGYWLDPDLNITAWSGDGYPANMMFIEYGGDGIYNLGNSASSTPSGTTAKLTFDLALVDDPDTFVQFIVAVTFE